MIVREYTNKDYEEVSKLLLDVFNVKKVKDGCNDTHKEFVAEIDGHVVGYFLLTRVDNPIEKSFYYLVDWVCVNENYRNQHIGRKMMEFAETFARKNKAKYLQLTSSYYRKAAHKLYEECGYEKRESAIFRKVLK